MASVKTQGTELFFIDPEDDSIVKVGCPTSITGLTAARDQIEVTCLDSAAREYVAGMPTPGTANFGINFDPSDPSHIRLHELYRDGTTLEWALGLGDYTPPPPAAGPQPTGVSSGGQFILPATRTWITFTGYLSDFPFDLSLNAVVTNAVAIQVSDFPVVVPKA